MNPHISLPRHQAHFGSLPARSSASRVPPFFRRLVKFPQMDFEMAVWEMTTLLVAPKKVFKSMYYHACLLSPRLGDRRADRSRNVRVPSFPPPSASFPLPSG